MTDSAVVLALWAAFAATHMVPSSARLRPRLVAAQNGSYPDEASQPWSKYDAVLLHHDVYFHLAAREPGCKNIPQPHLCAYAYRRKGVATRCAAIRHAFQRHERAPSQV